MTFRLALADALRPLEEPAAVKNGGSGVLGRHLGADRVVFVELLPDEGLLIERGYSDGVPDTLDRHRLDDYGPLLLRELRAGGRIVSADVPNDPAFTDLEKARCVADRIVAKISVPIFKDGRLVAILGVHQSSTRSWADDEVALAEDAAERIWSAVERVRAEAAVRDQEAMLSLAFVAANLMMFTWDIESDRVERRMSRFAVLPSNRRARARTRAEDARRGTGDRPPGRPGRVRSRRRRGTNRRRDVYQPVPDSTAGRGRPLARGTWPGDVRRQRPAHPVARGDDRRDGAAGGRAGRP